jgi:hypothetical protein
MSGMYRWVVVVTVMARLVGVVDGCQEIYRTVA